MVNTKNLQANFGATESQAMPAHRRRGKDSVEELSEWREKIDKLDNQLCKILEDRFELVKEVGNYKKDNGASIEDKEREMLVINSKIGKTKLSDDFTREVFELIMKESKRIQGSGK